MQSDVATAKHRQREVTNFRGLFCAAEDTRSLPDGFLSVANNVVFDALGNARPKDGSAQWWAPISQRVYLAEMELGENGTWTNGSVETTVVDKGYQSRKINASGTTNMDRVFPAPVDVLLSGNYLEANAVLQLSVRAATPSDNTSVILYLSSGVGFAATTRSYDITSQVAALAAGAWTTISVALSSGSNVGGAPAFNALTRMRIAVVQTAGTNIYFDEVFVRYTDFVKSFCTGTMEYRRIADSQRFLVAGFGETVYADANENQAPFKILSGLTRNAPLYFETMDDRLGIFNGIDANYIYNGSFVRPLGFPAPTAWTPGFTYTAASGSLVPGDQYYYGVVFVYGNGAVRDGQSSIFVSPTTATVAGGTDTINLANLPVGAVGSGVVARRIYRSRKNAGPLATKYFLTEIADNTTTTFADGISDSILILNDEAPYNNGVPPIARNCVFFQKAAVYFTKSAVYWSRPGTNLDETVETVPAENILELGHMGDLIGGVEFNNNLYFWGRRGIGKLRWNGGTLEYLPVQRSAGSTAQGTGCVALRAVTVVKDRYLRWVDPEGHVWRMLPNEEILPDSAPVNNLLIDNNRKPVASSLDYYAVDSEAQWNTGTIGPNLDTSLVSGQLRYTDGSGGAASGDYSPVGVAVTSDPTPATNAPGATGQPRWAGLNSTVALQVGPAAAGRAIRLDTLRVRVETNVQSAGTINFTWNLRKAKYEASNTGTWYAGTVIDTGSTSVNAGGTPIRIGPIPPGSSFPYRIYEVLITLASPIYIPANEYAVVELIRTTAFGPGAPALDAVACSGSAGHLDLLRHYVTDYSNFNGKAVDIEFDWSGQYFNDQQIGPINTSDDYGANFQRYLTFNTNGVGGAPFIRGADKFDVYFSFSDTGTGNWTPWELLYTKQFLAAQPPAADQITQETFGFPSLPDYRKGQPYPSGTQWRYARTYVDYKLTGQPAPAAEAFSRVSTTFGDALPTVINPYLKISQEGSFLSPYNKKDYTHDIWTSEIVATAGISSFGRFALDYFAGQQDIFLQVRTATSAGGITAATWFDIPLNSVVGTTGVVASATHFQMRIIFQDNPSKNTGDTSFVNSLVASWAALGADLAPLTPPVLYHYLDYTFMSWCSEGSRVPDRSAAVDDHSDDFSEEQHRWSTFLAPHYTSYCVGNGKLIGGAATGGRLNLLRQSAVTEADGGVIQATLSTLPMNLGTMYIKTLHYLYMGMVLNQHRLGYFQRELSAWPSAGSFAFRWFVSGNTMPAVSFGGPPTPGVLQLFGQASGQQDPTTELPHAATQMVLTNFPTMKPYQTEYGFDMGVQERAFCIGLTWSPFQDGNGNSIFPTVPNFGMEYFVENIRGL